jgi:hypothetical protein
MRDELDFSILEGRTINSIIGSVGEEVMEFVMENGEEFRLYHSQD